MYLYPPTEPIQTMVPVLRSRIYGRKARLIFKGANTLVLVMSYELGCEGDRRDQTYLN